MDMSIEMAITLVESAINEADIHNNESYCDVVDGVNREALDTLLNEVKKK